MNNEKYVNYYVEILTNTMQDVIIRNVSLQANARITEEVVKNQSELLENLQNDNSSKINELENLVASLSNQLNEANQKFNELNSMRSEYDSVRHQVQHVDTFRNELLKERDEHQKTRNDYEDKIKELNYQIEYLQLTPAKRKKIDEAKTTVDVFEMNSPTIIKDGGSF
jgi:uncharacterized coiled-coil DUF342 family protein